jgi:hypothetical protein
MRELVQRAVDKLSKLIKEEIIVTDLDYDWTSCCDSIHER